jgi:hypothetical protein
MKKNSQDRQIRMFLLGLAICRLSGLLETWLSMSPDAHADLLQLPIGISGKHGRCRASEKDFAGWYSAGQRLAGSRLCV